MQNHIFTIKSEKFISLIFIFLKKVSNNVSDSVVSIPIGTPHRRGEVLPSPFSVLVLNAVKYVLSPHDTHSAVDAEKYDACISFLQSRSPDWLKRELSLTNSLGFYGKIMQILKPEVVILESLQANTEQDNKEISLAAINAPVRQENKSDKEISDDILYLLEQHYGYEKANGFLEVFPPTGVVAHIRKLSQNTNYESVIEQMRSDVDYFSFVFFSKRN